MSDYQFTQNDLDEIKAFIEAYTPSKEDMSRACRLRWRLDAVIGIRHKLPIRYGQQAWISIFENCVLPEGPVSLPCLFYSNDKAKCDAIMKRIHFDLMDRVQLNTGMSYDDFEFEQASVFQTECEVDQ